MFSSEKNCLFRSFPHFFKLSYWLFLLLSCMNSLCNLNISPFSDMWFANILSHSPLKRVSFQYIVSFLKNNCIYLFLAGLSLCYCTTFSLAAVCRLLAVGFLVAELGPKGAWASVVAAPGLWRTGSIVVAHGLSYSACGTFPGMEPMSPALAGGFFTTEPPGKPLIVSSGMQKIFGLM